MARPTKLTPEIREKLEQVVSFDASIEEVCFYIDISKDTFYRWIKKDKKLAERLEALRQKPVLKARQTVVGSLDDPNNAFRYLEKKKRKEFGQNFDITSDGEKIEGIDVTIFHGTNPDEGDGSISEKLPEQKENSGEPGIDGKQQDV